MSWALGFLALLGLGVGSFINTAAFRLLSEERLSGRSRCTACATSLRWFELIPLVSFLIQRGRCRSCGSRISARYPAGEFAAAFLFAALGWRFFLFSEVRVAFQNSILERSDALFLLELALWLTYLSILLVFFQTDLTSSLLPDRLMYPATALAFAGSAFEVFGGPWEGGLHWLGPYQWLGGAWAQSWFGWLLAASAAALFFFVISFVSRGQWMGWGDGKLAFLLGMMFGFPEILVLLGMGFLLGGVSALVLLALGRAGRKSQVPLGPFLIVGAFSTIFFGESLLRWYFSLFPLVFL